jgi:hypothetical protein
VKKVSDIFSAYKFSVQCMVTFRIPLNQFAILYEINNTDFIQMEEFFYKDKKISNINLQIQSQPIQIN